MLEKPDGRRKRRDETSKRPTAQPLLNSRFDLFNDSNMAGELQMILNSSTSSYTNAVLLPCRNGRRQRCRSRSCEAVRGQEVERCRSLGLG